MPSEYEYEAEWTRASEQDEASTADAHRADYAHEILALQAELVMFARTAFQRLPANARGELICGVRDARFAVGLWANHVGPRLIRSGFEELGAEADNWYHDLATSPHTGEVLVEMTEHTANRVEATSHDPQRSKVASVLRSLASVFRGFATAE